MDPLSCLFNFLSIGILTFFMTICFLVSKCCCIDCGASGDGDDMGAAGTCQCDQKVYEGEISGSNRLLVSSGDRKIPLYELIAQGDIGEGPVQGADGTSYKDDACRICCENTGGPTETCEAEEDVIVIHARKSRTTPSGGQLTQGEGEEGDFLLGPDGKPLLGPDGKPIRKTPGLIYDEVLGPIEPCFKDEDDKCTSASTGGDGSKQMKSASADLLITKTGESKTEVQSATPSDILKIKSAPAVTFVDEFNLPLKDDEDAADTGDTEEATGATEEATGATEETTGATEADEAKTPLDLDATPSAKLITGEAAAPSESAEPSEQVAADAKSLPTSATSTSGSCTPCPGSRSSSQSALKSRSRSDTGVRRTGSVSKSPTQRSKSGSGSSSVCKPCPTSISGSRKSQTTTSGSAGGGGAGGGGGGAAAEDGGTGGGGSGAGGGASRTGSKSSGLKPCMTTESGKCESNTVGAGGASAGGGSAGGGRSGSVSAGPGAGAQSTRTSVGTISIGTKRKSSLNSVEYRDSIDSGRGNKSPKMDDVPDGTKSPQSEYYGYVDDTYGAAGPPGSGGAKGTPLGGGSAKLSNQCYKDLSGTCVGSPSLARSKETAKSDTVKSAIDSVEHKSKESIRTDENIKTGSETAVERRGSQRLSSETAVERRGSQRLSSETAVERRGSQRLSGSESSGSKLKCRCSTSEVTSNSVKSNSIPEPKAMDTATIEVLSPQFNIEATPNKSQGSIPESVTSADIDDFADATTTACVAIGVALENVKCPKIRSALETVTCPSLRRFSENPVCKKMDSGMNTDGQITRSVSNKAITCPSLRKLVETGTCPSLRLLVDSAIAPDKVTQQKNVGSGSRSGICEVPTCPSKTSSRRTSKTVDSSGFCDQPECPSKSSRSRSRETASRTCDQPECPSNINKRNVATQDESCSCEPVAPIINSNICHVPSCPANKRMIDAQLLHGISERVHSCLEHARTIADKMDKTDTKIDDYRKYKNSFADYGGYAASSAVDDYNQRKNIGTRTTKSKVRIRATSTERTAIENRQINSKLMIRTKGAEIKAIDTLPMDEYDDMPGIRIQYKDEKGNIDKFQRTYDDILTDGKNVINIRLPCGPGPSKKLCVTTSESPCCSETSLGSELPSSGQEFLSSGQESSGQEFPSSGPELPNSEFTSSGPDIANSAPEFPKPNGTASSLCSCENCKGPCSQANVSSNVRKSREEVPSVPKSEEEVPSVPKSEEEEAPNMSKSEEETPNSSDVPKSKEGARSGSSSDHPERTDSECSCEYCEGLCSESQGSRRKASDGYNSDCTCGSNESDEDDYDDEDDDETTYAACPGPCPTFQKVPERPPMARGGRRPIPPCITPDKCRPPHTQYSRPATTSFNKFNVDAAFLAARRPNTSPCEPTCSNAENFDKRREIIKKIQCKCPWTDEDEQHVSFAAKEDDNSSTEEDKKNDECCPP